MKQTVNSTAVPFQLAVSHAAKSDGKVYVSGNVGCDKHRKLVEGGVQPQTRAALENMKSVLEAAGSDLKHVVKVTVYLADLPRDFVWMNSAYSEFFPTDPPARTCLGVAALPLGALVQFECVAELAPVPDPNVAFLHEMFKRQYASGN